jgi:hypothetical protein
LSRKGTSSSCVAADIRFSYWTTSLTPSFSSLWCRSN